MHRGAQAPKWLVCPVCTEKPKRPSGELALFVLQRLSPQLMLNVQKGPGPLVVSFNCMHKGAWGPKVSLH